jgi:azurin
VSEATLRSSTRTFRPELVRLLNSLKPGQRIRITHQVRVGTTATWTATVEGVFRGINHLATGLATDRVPEDDIVVVALHFTKDNGELSSVTLDEHTQVEALS